MKIKEDRLEAQRKLIEATFREAEAHEAVKKAIDELEQRRNDLYEIKKEFWETELILANA